jgi:hypothetical protein
MFPVARVYPFGGKAHLEVFPEFQSAVLFKQGYAVFFGAAGVNGRFIDDIITFFKDPADRLRGFQHRRKIGELVLINGGGNGNNMEMGLPEIFRIGGEMNVTTFKIGRFQFPAGIDIDFSSFRSFRA